MKSSNYQLSKMYSSRPYKSRNQRPCDFCRKRKTCCIITDDNVCISCKKFNQDKCTFDEGPIKRIYKKKMKVPILPSQGVIIKSDSSRMTGRTSITKSHNHSIPSVPVTSIPSIPSVPIPSIPQPELSQVSKITSSSTGKMKFDKIFNQLNKEINEINREVNKLIEINNVSTRDNKMDFNESTIMDFKNEMIELDIPNMHEELPMLSHSNSFSSMSSNSNSSYSSNSSPMSSVNIETFESFPKDTTFDKMFDAKIDYFDDLRNDFNLDFINE
ncbi:hypothetical protein CLIB1444_02S04566 [[Candida] jaroonii]|uniref:Uncharacterized protein n=1 Tax=[Candida] jaroonii TaxID=467808 RepID=A0ACA9Y3N5_9ASCO|nr:hypothetical protein CLIB1444_02S04566 [[Candida] jaroonii]